MGDGTCRGCGVSVTRTPGARQRIWCSESCRVSAWRRSLPPDRLALVKADARRAARGRRVPKVHPPRLCVECAEPFTPRRNDQTICSTRCRNRRVRRAQVASGVWQRRRAAYLKRHPEQLASAKRRRALKRGATAERFADAEIFERDGWRCGLCGRLVDKALKYPDLFSPSLDHVLPLSKGGQHTRANVQLAHLTCNIKKRDRVNGAGDQLRLIG